MRSGVLDLPPRHLPLLRHAESVRSHFAASNTLNRQFAFNLPTHYLCFVPVLAAWGKEHGASWADVREPIARPRRFSRPGAHPGLMPSRHAP
jgi:hypothetical protein